MKTNEIMEKEENLKKIIFTAMTVTAVAYLYSVVLRYKNTERKNWRKTSDLEFIFLSFFLLFYGKKVHSVSVAFTCWFLIFSSSLSFMRKTFFSVFVTNSTNSMRWSWFAEWKELIEIIFTARKTKPNRLIRWKYVFRRYMSNCIICFALDMWFDITFHPYN